MSRNTIAFLALTLFFPACLPGQSAGSFVRFHTTLGDIDVALLTSAAPNTVANFLKYVDRGAYNNSLIHRSVPGFIIQGGGFQLQNHAPVAIPQDAPVVNEYSVSNTRGTLAMAKLGSDPNSATNQWFFNLTDNSQNLNNQNGGFTVFGRVLNAAGLAVMDKIAAVPVPSPGPFASPFDQIPLFNYGGGTVQDENFVLVLSVTRLDDVPVPTIGENGIVTASSFGGFPWAAPASYIEIFGSYFSTDTRGWTAADFSNGTAPTSLSGVSVTVNGRPAYVYYVSPTQVNAQIPGITPSGGQVPVVVTFQGQSSAPVMLTVKQYGAGLLAPPAFKIKDKQYAAAVHSSTGAFVSNGSIPGVPAAPAVPGETLLLYGIGFGPVTPSSTAIAGQIVRVNSTITTALKFNIGDTPAEVSYAGLVTGLVGVYQFNVKVPADAPNGDLPVQVFLGDQAIPQTLFLPVQAPQK
ncbi:MAG: peptidylprolyl isomerase [Acidobacteriota bacterium]|nr:peptidylprolyl isomerase [Acidobacteriota bacterium]